jgi:hypothetical protein
VNKRLVACFQVREIKEVDQQAKLHMQLRECEQVLRIGPGGDIRSYLQRKKRSVMLSMLLGESVPLKAGVKLLELLKLPPSWGFLEHSS